MSQDHLELRRMRMELLRTRAAMEREEMSSALREVRDGAARIEGGVHPRLEPEITVILKNPLRGPDVSAADVLAELGVRIDLSPDAIGRSIREAGVGFMFAPNHHSAMKYVGPTRVEIGTRTIFNLLGPVSNPAGVKRLLLGVFAESWVEPIANVHAFVEVATATAGWCTGAVN